MSFASLVTDGIKRMHTEDFEAQRHFLSVLYEEVRKTSHVPESLFKSQAFFVPNPEYMLTYFGPRAKDPEFDLYAWDGNCFWDNFIVFPIKNISGTIVGFAGFDPFTKLKKEDGSGNIDNYYRYSNSTVYNRGKYLFILDGVYRKAIKDGYIILADGIFDNLSLADTELNSASVLGSTISPEILFQLKFIETIFVAEDNDRAGRDVYLFLKKRLPNVKYLRQNATKDADDILKSKHREEYIRQVKWAVKTKSDLVIRFKPGY